MGGDGADPQAGASGGAAKRKAFDRVRRRRRRRRCDRMRARTTNRCRDQCAIGAATGPPDRHRVAAAADDDWPAHCARTRAPRRCRRRPPLLALSPQFLTAPPKPKKKLHPFYGQQATAVLPRKRFYRTRAHSNPLNAGHGGLRVPAAPPPPERWAAHFPGFFAAAAAAGAPLPEVRFADVGCGFGGLLVRLAPLYPDKLALGLELRDKVAAYVRERVVALRHVQRGLVAGAGATGGTSAVAAAAGAGAAAAAAANTEAAAAPAAASNPPASTAATDAAVAAVVAADPAGAPVAGGYENISVLRANAMRHLPNYFRAGQLEKLFFCFPDPHFKAANRRRRIVTVPLLSEYAHLLAVGGRVYAITDVPELGAWMRAQLEAHPLFAEVAEEELKGDAAAALLPMATEEGQKVARNGGATFVSVFERLAAPVEK
jgi:tRNA (guanine-N7-)-methyltransferase